MNQHIMKSNKITNVDRVSQTTAYAKMLVSRFPIWRVMFPMLASLKDINELDDMKEIQANNFRLANDPVAYAEFMKGIG